ncbi:MAG: DUF2247 family protein [Bacteroidota bacterium]
MIKTDNLKVTWGVLFTGLKKDWLSSNEVVKIINEYSTSLAIDKDLWVDFNVNEDDKDAILELIKQTGPLEEEHAIKHWQQSVLISIKDSNQTVEEKLKDIELQWARFDYPKSWKSFITYMPNSNSSSNEDLYENFLSYIDTLQ